MTTISVALLAILGATVHAGLNDWVRNIEDASPLKAIFFKPLSLPSGLVFFRRPPRETRAALAEKLAAAPSNAELLALRALEAEQELDFAAAEADWKKHAQVAIPQGGTGQLALADFYHRRLRPQEEVQALAAAAQAPSPPSERLAPEQEQRSWRAFQRIFALIQAQAMPPAVAREQYRAWMARYPRAASVYQQSFDFLLVQKDFAAADAQIAAYHKAFPSDRIFPVKARASLERRRGSVEQALAVYERAFQPLWPPELVQEYFRLLGETRRLRAFLERARAALAANPDDLNAAARIFYYHQQQGNLAAAERALQEFRLRKEARKASWTAQELLTVARLSEAVHNVEEAARLYYALYSFPGSDGTSTENALAGLIQLLFTAPEQPIRLGAGDLSFYRDVAVMDPYPGFLNGILSLLLNSTSPAQHYAEQERASVAYFHRARAAELLALFETRFPKSARRAALRLQLLEAYATYGDSDAVIRGGRQFLTAFPKGAERTRVALLMAEAFARKRQVKEEFATYDALLQELAARADNVPLGPGAGVAQQPPEAEQQGESQEQEEEEEQPQRARGIRRFPPGGPAEPPQRSTARSPDYARVLDRYVSRLVVLKRIPDALALYRREIDRNPNDPGLYERLAAFLEQNRLAAEIEPVYRRAMQQFPDRSWHHRLARWYLRRKQAAEFDKLTREVVKIFSGSDLEKYFGEMVNPAQLDPLLYRQLNLFAHERFPYNLAFVRNLLSAYTRRETADLPAWERLLRSYWFYDDDLRARFFAFLSSSGRLKGELDALRAAQPAANPAAAQFVGEAEAWQSHFEAAAPVLRALAAQYPADAALGRRAAVLHRSLAPFEPAYTEAAASLEENLHRYDPRDRATLARLGEIYADREMFDRARPYWNRIAEIEPGKADGYLEAATVFWDYFLFDDALRLMAEGRKRLANPALYSYEAGAIYENRRDYARAVQEYVKGALAESAASNARGRLLELARRPAFRKIIEEATAKRVAGENPDAQAVLLRVAVLETQNRRDDLEKFLLALVERATSLDLLARTEREAVRLGFDAVQQRSLERQAQLTTDPLERLRLRLALARFHEGRRDVEAARRAIEALYNDHPTLLGVVRAAVDFHWRNKTLGRAVEILTRASGAAYPALKKQFLFEAARKSTEAGQYAQARKLLAPLLVEDPFHAEYLAAMADTYARAGDDSALRDFYLANIQALAKAPLAAAVAAKGASLDVAAEERTARVAALRRGLIPALTRLKDYAGAVDQYVEIINRYAEDEALTLEAALYAAEHGRQQQLRAYYTKTAADSPRDFRWPMVLGRLETHFENFPAAIAAYARATEIRPDRTDLHAARAGLEERLLRFDDALRDYARLYDLTYKNPQWMEKVAEVHARRGETDAAVQALRRALIEGRPERPQDFFQASRRLESWEMLAPARQMAERGVELAGNDLFVDAEYSSGAQVYARLMTRLREYEAAYTRLVPAYRAAPERALPGFQSALRQMGEAVVRYFTPEEKTAFVSFLEKQKAALQAGDFVQALLPLAETAGLAELETRWRHELMMATPGPIAQAHHRRLADLQRRRMKFDELGAQLEAYWKVYPATPEKDSILDEAASAYRSAENTEAELRLLSLREQRGGLSGESLERYFELLLARDPQRLVAIAESSRRGELRNAAVGFAITRGDASLARRAVAARGRSLVPLWTRAYTALAGLYHSDASPEVNAAFVAALGPETIGERVGKPVDRNQQLAGNVWFYYGSRYGEYLGVTKQGRPEDYLPATLEATPGNAAAYFTLAEYYEEAGDSARALADYAHALELDPNRAEAHDRVAVVLWEQGRKDEAVTRWRSALAAFARLQDRGRLTEAFWTDLPATLEHIGKRSLLPAVREEADRLLRAYVRRNGAYRAGTILLGVLAASGTPETGVAWILDLSRAAPNPVSFLTEIVEAAWMPKAQRDQVYRRIVEAAGEQLAQAHGEARGPAQETLYEWQGRWIAYLLGARQTDRARALLEAIPEDWRRQRSYELAPLEIRIATQAGRLEPLLERYRREPEKMPGPDNLRAAATALRQDGDAPSARRVLEFLYTRELERRNFSAANFLGLAEVRLEAGDAAGALALLRRMNLVSGEPFENLEPAAALLEKAGRPADAVEFLATRVRAVPWDAAARVRLAGAQLAAKRERVVSLKLLAAVAAAREVPYETRIAAAFELGNSGPGGVKTGSAELDLLAAGEPTDATAAEQPFFFRARLLAAGRIKDPATRLRLLLGALEIEPQNDAPRIPVLQAALESGRYQLAVASMEPFLERGGFRYLLQQTQTVAEREESEPPEPRFQAEQFMSGAGLDAAQRALAARGLATAFEKLRQWRAAELFLRAAIELESSAPARAELERSLGAVKARRIVETKSMLRRPFVADHVEQPAAAGPVRPRLAPQGGGAQ